MKIYFYALVAVLLAGLATGAAPDGGAAAPPTATPCGGTSAKFQGFQEQSEIIEGDDAGDLATKINQQKDEWAAALWTAAGVTPCDTTTCNFPSSPETNCTPDVYSWGLGSFTQQNIGVDKVRLTLKSRAAVQVTCRDCM